MIEAKELLFALDSRLNKVASLKNQGIPIPNKIIAINDAIIKCINSKVDINNIYRLGFQAFLTRIAELQVLLVKEEKLKPTLKKDAYTTYQVAVKDLEFPIYMPTTIVGEAKRDDCNGRLVFAPRLNKNADIPLLIKDSNYQPSFRFQETLATYQSGVIDMYVDDPEGEFEIENMYISYLRYPKKVDIDGYRHFNGEMSINQDCELPYSMKDDIVTIAVTELAYSTNNMGIIQPNILNNDKYN